MCLAPFHALHPRKPSPTTIKSWGIGGDLVQDLGKDGALLVAVPRQALCPLLVAVVACKGVVDLRNEGGGEKGGGET